MGLFGKSKKKSSCCDLQFVEIKKDENKKTNCCDIKIEEVKDEKKEAKESNESCCGN